MAEKKAPAESASQSGTTRQKVADHWPKAGLRWPKVKNSKGARFIAPLRKRPRYLQSIVRAIDSAFAAHARRPKEMKNLIDAAFGDMIIVATDMVGELRHVTMVDWFNALEKNIWWKNDGLPRGAVATLFLEIAKARADWKAAPTEPFDVQQHSETARKMDVFQMKLGELARDVKYEVYKRDPYGKVHLIEQGGIEYFTARGLLVEMEVGEDVVSSELVDDIHRLTIGAVYFQDVSMEVDSGRTVPEVRMEEGNKAGGDHSEEGDAALDCTSD